MKAILLAKELLVGNFKLMDKFGIAYDMDTAEYCYTIIAIAYDKKYAAISPLLIV